MMLSSNEIKIAGIVEESIVDGPGIRFTIFTQGCPHKCRGCHNPQTHSFEGGRIETIDNLVSKINENPLLKGVTFSGGEPFMQASTLSKLIDNLDTNNLDIITYTGFRFEDLLAKNSSENNFLELLKRTDILIDGKFEIENKKENLKYRGSSNQRVIDVKKSLKEGKIVEYNF